jgi:hypothetical protein
VSPIPGFQAADERKKGGKKVERQKKESPTEVRLSLNQVLQVNP